jgi:hypothetical protein
MRKFANRKAGRTAADDPDAANKHEGSAPGDALKTPKLALGADRHDSNQDGQPEGPSGEGTHRSADVELPLDYTKLGEHVAFMVKAVEIAAEEIREEAQRDAERIREHAQQEATTRVDEANREADKMLTEANRLRAETEEAAKLTRERADAYAEEQRRAAETEASKVIERAEQLEARKAQAEEERRKTLQQDIELTEKRLNQLVAGLRDLALGLETLVDAETPAARGDEDQTSKPEETLDESLRASIGTQAKE